MLTAILARQSMHVSECVFDLYRACAQGHCCEVMHAIEVCAKYLTALLV
jgi:hypothetical protein